MKALIVKDDGLIYAAEVPECQMCEGECIHKPDPKASAILCADQEKAKDLCWRHDERIGNPIPFLFWKENMLKAGQIYPIPDLQFEMKEEVVGVASNVTPFGSVSEFRQVAILKESSAEQESQEDLWRRVERYIDWPYQEINVTELMKQFTITRKP